MFSIVLCKKAFDNYEWLLYSINFIFILKKWLFKENLVFIENIECLTKPPEVDIHFDKI